MSPPQPFFKNYKYSNAKTSGVFFGGVAKPLTVYSIKYIMI